MWSSPEQVVLVQSRLLLQCRCQAAGAETSTGFFGQDRQHIRHLVHTCGGTYSGDLLADYTTHLVYKDLALAKDGEKFATALSWGIPVMPFSWLQSNAQSQHELPATYKPSASEPVAASPATKLQQLSLQDSRLCKGSGTAQRHEHKADCTDRAAPHAGTDQTPRDVASQVDGQHSVIHSGRADAQADTAQELELLSCKGSCQTDPSEALLTQSPSAGAILPDASGSDTCSDHCSPIPSVSRPSDPHTLHLLGPAAAEPSSPRSSDEVVIPDSQPDDPATYHPGQQLALSLTPVAEGSTPELRSSPNSPGTHGHGAVADSPSSELDETQSDIEHITSQDLALTASDASPAVNDSWQAPGSLQHVAAGPVGACDSDGEACEAIPDTELQASPSSGPDVQFALPHSSQGSAAGSSHAQELMSGLQQQHADRSLQQEPLLLPQLSKQQHVQQQQQQHLQSHVLPFPEQACCTLQEQHSQQQQNTSSSHSDALHHSEQLEPSLSDSVSRGSPSTSSASCAFVIEDSDDESDFQAQKPARPSTGSCYSIHAMSRTASDRCEPDLTA